MEDLGVEFLKESFTHQPRGINVEDYGNMSKEGKHTFWNSRINNEFVLNHFQPLDPVDLVTAWGDNGWRALMMMRIRVAAHAFFKTQIDFLKSVTLDHRGLKMYTTIREGQNKYMPARRPGRSSNSCRKAGGRITVPADDDDDF